MNWPFRKKKKYYALTGDLNGSLLAEIQKGGRKEPVLTLLGVTSGISVTDKTNIHRLLSQVATIPEGEISLALPLSFFATKNITLPSMPKEAIDQALPFHLSKVIDQPLNDLLYDWQITQHLKNQIVVTAYLFPRAIHTVISKAFHEKRLELTSFECDVFAAFSLLDIQGRLKEEEASLCLIIWSNSVSIAVYEKRVLSVARSVSLGKPDTPFSPDQQATGTIQQRPVEAAPPPPTPPSPRAGYIDDSEMDAILMNFDILKQDTGKTGRKGTRATQSPTPSPLEMETDFFADAQATMTPAAWSDYLNHIILEVVRTRDYYASVAKGKSIRNIYVGGAGDCFEELQQLAQASLNLTFERLARDGDLPDNCPETYGTICVGTGARW